MLQKVGSNVFKHYRLKENLSGYSMSVAYCLYGVVSIAMVHTCDPHTYEHDHETGDLEAGGAYRSSQLYLRGRAAIFSKWTIFNKNDHIIANTQDDWFIPQVSREYDSSFILCLIM